MIKKIFALLLLLTVIAGCINVVEKPIEPQEISPAPVKTEVLPVREEIIKPGEPIVEEIPEQPIEEPIIVEQDLSPAVAALRERADKKVKSYSYIYAPPPKNLARDTIYVKGNKIKIQKFDVSYVNPSEYYDTIYLDAHQKTAYGFCESEEKARCPTRNKRFILDYNKVMDLSPYQIVRSIPYGDIIGSELLWSRTYQVVGYEKNGIHYKVWVDSFSGLASKKALFNKDGDEIKRYEFRHLQINNVPDEEVEQPRFWA